MTIKANEINVFISKNFDDLTVYIEALKMTELPVWETVAKFIKKEMNIEADPEYLRKLYHYIKRENKRKSGQ